DTTVYALDAATGDPVWTAETGGLVRGGPTVANGTVYVGSTGGYLYAFDAATGQRYWTSNLFAEIHTAPTVVNGTIYVSTDRNVHAIETRHTATSSDSRVALGTLGHEATWAEQAPTALFDIDPSVPRVGDPATFDATRSVGTIESYAWDFTGDGDPDTTGGTVTQSFESVGEYPVTLTVTDTAGRTATRAVPVAVSLPPVVGEHPPRDPTGDGRYEDVDGDGTVDIFDVQALFTGLDSDAVQSHAGAFDFDGDGTVGVLDVQALFERVSGAF
ncbi:MAG: PKD repeat protein, partial [Halovenus sp.]